MHCRSSTTLAKCYCRCAVHTPLWCVWRVCAGQSTDGWAWARTRGTPRCRPPCPPWRTRRAWRWRAAPPSHSPSPSQVGRRRRLSPVCRAVVFFIFFSRCLRNTGSRMQFCGLLCLRDRKILQGRIQFCTFIMVEETSVMFFVLRFFIFIQLQI